MASERVFEMMEVSGCKICGGLQAPKRDEDKITDLCTIIKQKNTVIEQQTEYIAELQEEIRKLRSMVKMLSL